MSDDAPKVVSLRPWLNERESYFEFSDLKMKMLPIIAEAIQKMRDLGGTSEEIADQLAEAVEELRSVQEGP